MSMVNEITESLKVLHTLMQRVYNSWNVILSHSKQAKVLPIPRIYHIF